MPRYAQWQVIDRGILACNDSSSFPVSNAGFALFFSGSSYCHRRGSQGDLFEASEKIVEEEEDEDYDDDAFEKSFSKAFEPPGASRLKGNCRSATAIFAI